MTLDSTIRQQEQDRTDDGGTVLASVAQDTDKGMHLYRLDFRIGVALYTQPVYAENLIDAMRLALDTIGRVTAWEGPADEMSLTEVEEI